MCDCVCVCVREGQTRKQMRQVAVRSQRAPRVPPPPPRRQVVLEVDGSETSARFVKARLERTTLGQVSHSVRIVLSAGQAHVRVRLDLGAISDLQLGIGAREVRRALVAAPKLKLKPDNIRWAGWRCGVGVGAWGGK